MKGNTQNRIDKFLKDIGIYAIGNLGSKLTTGIISSFYMGIFSILFVVLLNMGITGIFLTNIFVRVVALIYIELRIKIIANYFHFNIKNRVLKHDILKYSLPLLPGVIY